MFERERARKRIVCVNAAAAALGIEPGQEPAAAAALAPSLQSFERNPRAERAALAALCAAAYRCASRISSQPHGAGLPGVARATQQAVWLDIGASLRLFGGWQPIAGKLVRDFAALGHEAVPGIAPTPEGAWLLAGREPVTDGAALWRALGALPLSALPADADTLAALRGSGLRRAGEVLEIPLDALARRFEPAFTDWLGRATGRLPDARRAWMPPPRYRRVLELAGEIETTEGLRFPVRRLLAEFAHYLDARDTGVQRFVLELEPEHGGTFVDPAAPGFDAAAPAPARALPQRDAAHRTRLPIALASPSRDPLHLQVVLQARLEHLALPAPVRAVVIAADGFAPVRVRQFDLFAAPDADEQEWQSVVDRLRARLGAEAVQELGLRADARPEKSFVRAPAGAGVLPAVKRDAGSGKRALRLAEPGPAGAETVSSRPRPLWLLPEPRELRAPPAATGVAERIEGGWWDGADAQRDYYVTEGAAGARLWVYRDRISDRWYLHGLWA